MVHLSRYLKHSILKIRLVDVAGQKRARYGWAKHFGDAKSILFVAAINSYDKEAPEVPGMVRTKNSFICTFLEGVILELPRRIIIHF